MECSRAQTEFNDSNSSLYILVVNRVLKWVWIATEQYKSKPGIKVNEQFLGSITTKTLHKKVPEGNMYTTNFTGASISEQRWRYFKIVSTLWYIKLLLGANNKNALEP